MNDLEQLVNRSLSGDLDAFGELVRRFQDMAHGYAYSILGDFELAEDAAQEAFIKAYLKMADLREPAAFPGWFRRIVLGQCTGMVRRKRIGTVPIEEVGEMASRSADPRQSAERREMEEKVLEAVRALPEKQREATTLFYINGYSQNEIAEFLEVPLTTVKKRLHDSRTNLKGRMMDMVAETLKDNTLDERFSKKVVAELMARPRPLDILGHPVREIADAIRAAFSDYEEITSDERIPKSDAIVPESLKNESYHVDKETVLRTQTSDVTIRAMRGRKPPVRLLAAGRTFRAGREEDATHLKVFHQIDLLCIDEGAGPEAMKATVRRAIEAVLGPVELEWNEIDYHWWEDCLNVIATTRDGRRADVAGCGLIPKETLRENGFDPEKVSGFGLGMGLERLAMANLGLDDIRTLWQPPYVPEKTR
jgi:RNA polymerase sigma factor (sigma-70 family)